MQCEGGGPQAKKRKPQRKKGGSGTALTLTQMARDAEESLGRMEDEEGVLSEPEEEEEEEGVETLEISDEEEGEDQPQGKKTEVT